MMAWINETTLAVSSSLAASIIAKVTIAAALALIAVRLARRSRAAVRHAMLASAFGVMLLLPVVSLLAPPIRIAIRTASEEHTTPAGAADARAISPLTTTDASPRVTHAIPRAPAFSLPALPIAIWILGAALSLLAMVLGLLQFRSLRRSASPWPHGQSVAERLARDAGISRRIEVLLHAALPGPMTCGVAHPAILLSPDAQTWEVDDLNRAIVHELEHVRRGDWLGHCLARAICAAYWFHPLVWIAWRQLTLEAERACDDAVLGRSEATAYADQLVKLARRLLVAKSAAQSAAKSPLLAMANRADLAMRVGAVLDGGQRRGRAGALPVVFACAAAAALVITVSPLKMVAAPQAAAAQAGPEFDAVSIKLVDPNSVGEHSHENSDPVRLSMVDSLHRMIIRAYRITDGQLDGEPDWFKNHLYSIDAVTSAPAKPDQMMLMLRRVLHDRFQLELRQENKDLPVYVLEVAPGGPKFKELKPGEVLSRETAPPDVFARNFNSIENLMDLLNGVFGGRLKLDRPVVDHTHLTGKYNMQLRTSVEFQTDDAGRNSFQFPNLFHDMQSELGLKLVSARIAMPYFVVQHAAEPTAN